MKHSHLCDTVGLVAVGGLIAALSLVPTADQNFVLYAGLAAVGAYAYMTFEVIPKHRDHAVLAVAYREVLPPQIPSGVEHVNGYEHPTDQRGRPALLRVAA